MAAERRFFVGKCYNFYMFPLVHIYTATEVSKKKSALLVIGSVIPDLVWVNRAKIPPEKIHDNLDDFYSYIKKNHKDMLDLALGMKLHSNEVGADKYSHVYNGGYCYVKGKQILPELTKLIKTDNEKKISDLSHNFIEASLDILLHQDQPNILGLYKKSLSEVDLEGIASTISDYSKLDKGLLFNTIQTLFNVVAPENLASEKSIAENVLPKFIEISFKQKVSNAEVLKLLQKSVEISRKDYKELFSEMLAIMKKDFFEYN